MYVKFAVEAYIGKPSSCVIVCIYTRMSDVCVCLCRSNTQLCRQQANILQNHDSANVRDIEQGEAQHSKRKNLILTAVT
jgi:hypothetical protein